MRMRFVLWIYLDHLRSSVVRPPIPLRTGDCRLSGGPNAQPIRALVIRRIPQSVQPARFDPRAMYAVSGADCALLDVVDTSVLGLCQCLPILSRALLAAQHGISGRDGVSSDTMRDVQDAKTAQDALYELSALP